MVSILHINHKSIDIIKNMSAQTVLKQNNSVLAFANIEQWLETIPVGIIIIDTHGAIMHANQLAHEMFSFNRQTDKWFEVLQKNVKGSTDNGHYLYTQMNQYIVLKTQALPNNQGQLILLVDESEIKENNESILKTEKINSIGKLSASLAHQLRTPLSTAYLYLSNICPESTDKELKVYQEKIQEQLDNIKQQIDSVLLVHKGIDALCEKVDIIAEVKSLIEIFKALHPHMIFHVQAPNTIMNVVANRTSLKGALNNIVENAIQASTHHQAVYISINANNENVLIEVVDFGKGISHENLSKLMSGFFTTKVDGNGLGLSIARQIIEAHQGNLMIDSELGKYTKITISLPKLKD